MAAAESRAGEAEAKAAEAVAKAAAAAAEQQSWIEKLRALSSAEASAQEEAATAQRCALEASAELDAVSNELAELEGKHSAQSMELARLLGHQNQNQKIQHLMKIKQENNGLKEKVGVLQAEVKRLQRQAGGVLSQAQSNASSRASTPRRGGGGGMGGGCGMDEPVSVEPAALCAQLEATSTESHRVAAQLADALAAAQRALRVDANSAAFTTPAKALFAAAPSPAVTSTGMGLTADGKTDDAKVADVDRSADPTGTIRALVAALASSRATAEAAARRLRGQERENQLLASEVALYKPTSGAAPAAIMRAR